MAEQTIIIETTRLILRRFVTGNLEALFAFYSDPAVTKHIPDAPRTYEEAREELEWHLNGHPNNPNLGLWATIHGESGIGQGCREVGHVL